MVRRDISRITAVLIFILLASCSGKKLPSSNNDEVSKKGSSLLEIQPQKKKVETLSPLDNVVNTDEQKTNKAKQKWRHIQFPEDEEQNKFKGENESPKKTIITTYSSFENEIDSLIKKSARNYLSLYTKVGDRLRYEQFLKKHLQKYGNIEKEYRILIKKITNFHDFYSSQTQRYVNDVKNGKWAQQSTDYRKKSLAIYNGQIRKEIVKQLSDSKDKKIKKFRKFMEDYLSIKDRIGTDSQKKFNLAMENYLKQHGIPKSVFEDASETAMYSAMQSVFIQAKNKELLFEFIIDIYPETQKRIKAFKQDEKRLNELTMVSVNRSAFIKRYILVSGEVVDDRGKLISGAKITVSKNSDNSFSYDSSSGKFEFKINSPRSFPPKSYSVSAYKKKHHTMGRHPISLGETEIERNQFNSKTLRGDMTDHIMKRHKIIIVLDRQGELAQLNRCDGWISYQPNGSGSVMSFDKKSYSKIFTVENINSIKLLPKHCISFSATPNKHGRFKSKSHFPLDFPKEKLIAVDYPVEEYRLKINDSDPASGFWFVDPKKKGKYHQDNRMREAPESGYTKELVFGSKQKYQAGYFYIKINGKYGKGYVRKNSYQHDLDQNKAKCWLVIQMQPNGSRNLEIPGWFAIFPYLNDKPPTK